MICMRTYGDRARHQQHMWILAELQSCKVHWPAKGHVSVMLGDFYGDFFAHANRLGFMFAIFSDMSMCSPATSRGKVGDFWQRFQVG